VDRTDYSRSFVRFFFLRQRQLKQSSIMAVRGVISRPVTFHHYVFVFVFVGGGRGLLAYVRMVIQTGLRTYTYPSPPPHEHCIRCIQALN
jgi:hypothetical protein